MRLNTDVVKMCIPGQLLTLRIPGDISIRDSTCWRTGANTWLNPDLWAGWVFPANGWLRDHILLVLGTILNNKLLGAVVLDWRNYDSRFIVISEILKYKLWAQESLLGSCLSISCQKIKKLRFQEVIQLAQIHIATKSIDGIHPNL